MRRYNLPLNDNYTIKNSYHTKDKITCDNCNKIITNVVHINNSKNISYNVGVDCAETLSKLKGLYTIQAEFAEMKALKNKVKKASKEHKVSFKINFNGELTAFYFNQHNTEIQIFSKPVEFSKKYLPDYLAEVLNLEKIGFSYIEKIIDLGFENFLPKTNKDFKQSICVDKFEISISVKPYYHLVTKEISGYDFFIDIPGINYAKRCTMYKRLSQDINYAIMKHEFENYNNK